MEDKCSIKFLGDVADSDGNIEGEVAFKLFSHSRDGTDSILEKRLVLADVTVLSGG